MASPALRFSSASMEPLQLVRPPDYMRLTRWNRTRMRLVSPQVRRGSTPSPDAPGLILTAGGIPIFPLYIQAEVDSQVIVGHSSHRSNQKSQGG